MYLYMRNNSYYSINLIQDVCVINVSKDALASAVVVGMAGDCIAGKVASVASPTMNTLKSF